MTPGSVLLACGGGRLSHESHVLQAAEIDDGRKTGARPFDVAVVQNSRTAAFDLWKEKKTKHD